MSAPDFALLASSVGVLLASAAVAAVAAVAGARALLGLLEWLAGAAS